MEPTSSAPPPAHPLEPAPAPPAGKPAPPALVAASIALSGVGMGLLIYRVVVIGLTSSALRGELLIGAGIGAVIGARAMLRGQVKPRPVAALWALPGALLGLGLAFLIAPPAGALPLETRKLPGLSIGLPAGNEKSAGTAYDSGQLTLAKPAGYDTVMMLQWQPGNGTLDDDSVAMITGTLAKLLGAAPAGEKLELPVGNGLRSRTLTMSKDGDLGYMTMFDCGRRMFALMSIGSGARKLHQRALASVVCTPDPAQEAAPPSGPPLAFEPPEGWKQTNADGTQVSYEHEGRALTFVAMAPMNADMAAMLAALLEQITGAKARLSPRPDENGRKLWSFEVATDPVAHGLAASWTCGERQIVSLFVGADAEEASGLGKSLILSARCK